jgi:glutathione S-transferase
VYAYLEKVAPATGFLVGDSLSIADIAVSSMLVNLGYANAAVDPATYPKLAAFYARMSGRPSFVKQIAADHAMMGI